MSHENSFFKSIFHPNGNLFSFSHSEIEINRSQSEPPIFPPMCSDARFGGLPSAHLELEYFSSSFLNSLSLTTSKNWAISSRTSFMSSSSPEPEDSSETAFSTRTYQGSELQRKDPRRHSTSSVQGWTDP